MTLARRLHVRRVGGRIGAEVAGVDLAAPLDPATVAELAAALLVHKALFFRDQRLDDAGQVRFVSAFGALAAAHPPVPVLEDDDTGLAGAADGPVDAWHTDGTFVLSPPSVSTLRSLVVPLYGGDTLIANTHTAYADLPDDLRELADLLWAVHASDEEAEGWSEVPLSRRYATVHPVVRVHPESGERGLFIGGFARRLLGLSQARSREILRLLQAYVTRPDNTVRWRWAVGDVILLDNCATQHHAVDDHGSLPRRLRRVSAAGGVPVGVDGRRSHVLERDEPSQHSGVT